MRLITIALFTTSYLAAATVAAAAPQAVVVPDSGAIGSVSQSAAAANAAARAAARAATASNASANGAAHAAANSAAAASAAAGATFASNASANGAVNAAQNAAAAASAASSSAIAANAAANASANGAAHAAQNAAAAASAASSSAIAANAAANTSANGAAHAAQNAAAAANAASSSAIAANAAANASANGAAHAAQNAAAAASAASSSAIAANAAANASANGAAHAAQNAAAAASAGHSASGAPPGLAAKGGVPPGLADRGGSPPGQAHPGQAPGSPVEPVQTAAASPALVEIGGAPDSVAPSSAPPILLIATSPANSGVDAPGAPASSGGPAQALAQTSPPPEAGGDAEAAAKIETADRGTRAGSEQQQKVAGAVSAGLLEVVPGGAVVLKGQVLAVAPSPASMAIARRLGYTVVERLPLRDLGLSAAVLRSPRALTASQALLRLQTADPKGDYSLNPIYATTGQIGAPVPAASRPAAPPAGAKADAVAVGLIDTGVFVQHPALASSRLEQQGFAPGGLTPAKHGTAVASIAAGQAGAFRGVAPGSRIYVADVYGNTGVGGSATAVAEGLDWLVRKGAPVINISLVGPSNRLMEAAVAAAIRKGVIVVAAVGNDGPNSPPLYPAAYGGVLAVTAVDQKDRILFEAVRATPVAFAAPGADIFAADGAGGFAKVRGTSFAAPIVAGQLALAHRRQGSKDAENAVQGLKRAAKAPADAAFGFGIVGEDVREALRPGLTQFTTAEAGGSEHAKE